MVTLLIYPLTHGRHINWDIELFCGLPSITLQGTKADWKNILARIDKLDNFGTTEPKNWADLLRPILRRFIRTFDGERDLDFWQRIIHVDGPPGCDLCDSYSGWITAFSVWTPEGVWLPSPRTEEISARLSDKQRLILDGVQYPSLVPSNKICPGYAEVDVTLRKSGVDKKCKIVAGHVACQLLGPEDSGIRPFPGWFLLTTKAKVEDKHTLASASVHDMSVSPCNCLLRRMVTERLGYECSPTELPINTSSIYLPSAREGNFDIFYCGTRHITLGVRKRSDITAKISN